MYAYITYLKASSSQILCNILKDHIYPTFFNIYASVYKKGNTDGDNNNKSNSYNN